MKIRIYMKNIKIKINDPNKFGFKKVHIRSLFFEIKEENDYSFHQSVLFVFVIVRPFHGYIIAYLHTRA